MPVPIRLASTTATVIMILAMLPLAAAAASLETQATVQLVERLDAAISTETDGVASWVLQGSPADQLQVSVELREADGTLVQRLSGDHLTLDDAGRASAILPATSPGDPHTALPVTTLVICRE